MSEIDIIELTVAQLQQGMAQGRFTSEAVTEAFLDRIDRFNLRYNALIFLNPDAVPAARAIDRRRSTGEALPPLAGIPVVVKDSMDMIGLPTTGGWSRLHSGSGGVNLIGLARRSTLPLLTMRPGGVQRAPQQQLQPRCVCLGWPRKPAAQSKTQHLRKRWSE